MDFISNHHGNQLSNSGKQQVGMQSLSVLGFTSGNTEDILEMIDGFFNIYPDFIGRIPFICTAKCTGISTG